MSTPGPSPASGFYQTVLPRIVSALFARGAKATIDGTLSLARYPNVSVKVSGATNYSKEPYPHRDLNPHIKRVFEAFGPQRCYWGTDLTNGFHKATYRQRIAHFTEALDFLSEDDKDWVMGRAILAQLGWT